MLVQDIITYRSRRKAAQQVGFFSAVLPGGRNAASATPRPTFAACAPVASARAPPPPPVRSSRAGSAYALGISPLEASSAPAGSGRLGVAGGRGPAPLPRRSDAPN